MNALLLHYFCAVVCLSALRTATGSYDCKDTSSYESIKTIKETFSPFSEKLNQENLDKALDCVKKEIAADFEGITKQCLSLAGPPGLTVLQYFKNVGTMTDEEIKPIHCCIVEKLGGATAVPMEQRIAKEKKCFEDYVK